MIFAKEPFRDMEAELAELAPDHWEEVGRPDIPLDINWGLLHILEDAGALHVLTARDDGELVGYVIHVAAPATHYNIIQACDDGHYLKPEYRKGWAGMRMIRAAEEMLRDLGVKTISYHQKTRPDIDKGAVFERLGYELTERIYRKVL